MWHKPGSSLVILSAILLLGACGEPATDDPSVAEPTNQASTADTSQVASPQPAAPTNVAAASTTSLSPPAVTLHELMRDVIEPNAQRIWRAVSYTATAGGVEETMPVNDMDWDGLHQSGIILLEASHGLTIPGREVGGAAYESVRQNFQYSADEIAERRIQSAEDWNAIALGMGDLVREVLSAIDRRDLFALTETGAELNQACEACHAAFWYRP